MTGTLLCTFNLTKQIVMKTEEVQSQAQVLHLVPIEHFQKGIFDRQYQSTIAALYTFCTSCCILYTAAMADFTIIPIFNYYRVWTSNLITVARDFKFQTYLCPPPPPSNKQKHDQLLIQPLLYM